MNNPFIATFHNKISFIENNLIKKIQVNWLLNRGNEQKAIKKMLSLISIDNLPKKLCLEEAAKLIDYGIYTATGYYLAEALQHFEDPEVLGRIHFLLARCCQGLGGLEEAMEHLNHALEYQPDNSTFWNLQADCLLELGKWEDAVVGLHKSLRSAPGDAETIYRLGSIFLFHGEYGEALNCFSGCCKLKPYNPDYWEMHAEMLIKLGQLTAAGECFKKSLRYGGNIHVNTRLAYCYARTGKLNKAKRLLQKVLKYEPDDYEALCNLGGIQHQLNKDEQAYKLLKKAYGINCNDPLLLNNLGYICHSLGRSRKAIEYYKQALSLNPSDLTVLYNLAVCLYDKGIWEESRAILEKLVTIDRYNTEGWILLGNVYEQLANNKKAVDCFNKSLGLA